MRRPKLQLYNPRTIARMIREGRGQGEGEDYIPWLDVRSFSSRGLCHRFRSWKCGRRVIHLFSNLEFAVALLLDWSDKVRIYYEQYPLLPLEETVEIAISLGVEPSRDPHVRLPLVNTVDFLVESVCFEALWVKPASCITSRELEKFETMRIYLARRNIGCRILTNEQLPKALIASIQQIHAYRFIGDWVDLTSEIVKDAELVLRPLLEAGATMVCAARRTDDVLRLQRGSGLILLKHLLATKTFPLDPLRTLNFSQPLYTLCRP